MSTKAVATIYHILCAYCGYRAFSYAFVQSKTLAFDLPAEDQEHIFGQIMTEEDERMSLDGARHDKKMGWEDMSKLLHLDPTRGNHHADDLCGASTLALQKSDIVK